MLLLNGGCLQLKGGDSLLYHALKVYKLAPEIRWTAGGYIWAPDQTVDLKPLIGHVRDALLPLAEDLGVEIRLHLPENGVQVMGDRDELIEVIENLIENACKYGQEGKFVDVYLRGGGSQPAEVSVVDRGPGIPAEHVPRLTERFYRVSVADSRSKKGTGLGLAIVKHILTRHRARLIVKSRLGTGSEFTVRF